MNIILCIISYFVIGFIIGIVICKIKGKEWCRANDEFEIGWFDNNAQGIMYNSTIFWGFVVGCAILFSPFLIIQFIITYTSEKLQE